jgi:Rrf2 family protein
VKLQKNTFLALYSVLEFAAQPRRQFSTGEIADRYEVSAYHLAKVLGKLRRAGLVRATRGASGGYTFSGNAKRVTLLDIIDLFERIGAPRAAQHARRREAERALDSVLAEIDETAKVTFGSITLDTMLKIVRNRR